MTYKKERYSLISVKKIKQYNFIMNIYHITGSGIGVLVYMHVSRWEQT